MNKRNVNRTYVQSYVFHTNRMFLPGQFSLLQCSFAPAGETQASVNWDQHNTDQTLILEKSYKLNMHFQVHRASALACRPEPQTINQIQSFWRVWSTCAAHIFVEVLILILQKNVLAVRILCVYATIVSGFYDSVSQILTSHKCPSCERVYHPDRTW